MNVTDLTSHGNEEEELLGPPPEVQNPVQPTPGWWPNDPGGWQRYARRIAEEAHDILRAVVREVNAHGAHGLPTPDGAVRFADIGGRFLEPDGTISSAIMPVPPVAARLHPLRRSRTAADRGGPGTMSRKS